MADDNTIRPDEQRLVDGVELLKQTEGHIRPDHVRGTLSAEHADYLATHAVDPRKAENLGVRSLLSPDDTRDLPGVWSNWANFPAILFPWTSPDGRTEYQVRPDNPTKDNRGKPRKYVFSRDMTPVLWAVRPIETAERIVIVEGTKQTLAAMSYAPPGVGIYGIAGCRMWQMDGLPIPDLMVADGREVVIILDADAGENPDVYTAGLGLADALVLEGATRVSFGRLPGGGKNGLDDMLATRPHNRRASHLARLIDGAKSKPADRVPKPRKKGSGEEPSGQDGRVTVIVNRDRLAVINDLVGAMLSRWNAQRLFNHGGVISWLTDEGTMSPIDRGAFHDLVQQTAMTVTENQGAQGTTYGFSWPDAGTMSASMSRAPKFAPLDRISHAPFVRPDGTVVTAPGYDEATRTLLIPDETFAGIEVPDDPGPEQITAARELIMGEWLGDFPLETDADRANLLALVVTPAVRGLVPRAPLAVLDGLQMGVGKNLLADSLLTVYTGHPAQPMNWVSEPEELRKQITAAFRQGSEFFVFDEAHTLKGTALAQALTAETWQDRILGVSTMANFPNRVTWISLGNNVQVEGDITRRVYRIALRPGYANPQDRKASSFRHPGQSGLDLGAWTRKNRRELMVAILTLVRAWFAQGQPFLKRGVSFGSFEAWEKIVGGIVETAGLDDFLGNLKQWRSESDFDSQYWIGHLGWLREQFGSYAFRTGQVREKAMADPAGYLAPPRLDDPSDKGYGKALGEGYSRLRGRRYGSLWIERDGSAHGHVSVWRVFDVENPDPQEPPAPEPPEPEPEPTPMPDYDPQVSTSQPEAELLAFDLETGDADDLYRNDDPEAYVRIGGTAADDHPVAVWDKGHAGRYVADQIDRSEIVTGHNIMAFDLPALVRAGELDMSQVHRMAADGRLFDGLLAARFLDPPMAKDKGVDTTRKYDLGAVGEKYGLGSKLKDVSAELAKKYGWDKIPIDDSPEGLAFKGYLVQDVELSRKLYRELMSRFGTMPDYLVREHRVAALAAQIRVNGFLVDQPLLTERMESVRSVKEVALAELHEKWDIPLAGPTGKPYLSPLGTKAGKAALTAALAREGVTSIWRTEGTGEIEIGADHMKHLASEYGHLPRVVRIAQLVYSIVSARVVYETAFKALCPDGRVHPKISLQQATGRWSTTNPGLTVFGKRGGRHVERAVFLPDRGEVLISADLSQVDMRAVAGLSQDQAYIEMLRHDDPHAEIAESLFGDRRLREVAKPIGHGWNYGRSIDAISRMEEIDRDLVVQFDRSMREKFPRLVEWRDEVRAMGKNGQLLDNGFGRLMRPEPYRAHTQSPALMGQGAARDIMMEGLLRLDPRILPMLRAQIHDEIVLSVPEDQAEEVGRAVVEALSFDWRDVPILADVSRPGANWSICYEKN